MAYEISEALYAGVSTLENLGAYTSPEVFTDLYGTVLDGLKGSKVYGSEKNGTSDALKKGFLGAIKGKGEGYLYDDLAGAISAVQATRSAIGMGTPEKIYLPKINLIEIWYIHRRKKSTKVREIICNRI